MDAKTVIGFLLFMFFVAVVHWLIIDAIWKANLSDKEEPPSYKAVSAKQEANWSKTGPIHTLQSPRPDQAG